ncbi:MAG TPA: ATP-binding protein [Vicinamibacterales bacterium]|nr:ATP-binding protein [Vicinamibacterales bacterium]
MLLCLPAAATAQVRQVLILKSFDRGTITLDSFTDNFRIALSEHSRDTVTFVDFVVNPAGFEESPDGAIVSYLQSAFAGRPRPDLVVTIGGPAAAFARTHRQSLFPESPLLYAAFDYRFLGDAELASNEAAVAVRNDMTGMLEDILRLFPRTSNVFMVMGSSELGRLWRAELTREFEPYAHRVRFIWSDQMPYAEILRQVRTLPADSAVFYISLGVDGQRAAHSEDRIFADLYAAARVPLFGTQEPQLGRGIVGGRLMRTTELATTAAEVAFRLANGTPADNIPRTVLRPGTPIFDARELKRWRVAEAALPANSELRFRELTLWDRFKWPIVAGASALGGQSVLITALLVSRRRRQRAEQSLRESEGRFRVLANSAPVMIRMSGVDTGCVDVNVPWLAFTGRTLEQELGNGWVDAIHPDDRQRTIDAYVDAFARRQTFRAEYRLRRSDGEYRWVLDSGELRVTPDGTFNGYIDSVIDITDLKAARATLSSLNRRLLQAQEQERTRLARELHDDVCQRMTLLAIDLDQLGKALPEDAGDARSRIKELNDAVAALGSDIQGISHRLHSSKLEFLGLAGALRAFCREVSAQRGVTIDYAHKDVPTPLPEDVALSLFRVAQEALGNALKHSGASHYFVRIRGSVDAVSLEVVDDGAGFDVAAAMEGEGLGLVSMRERLNLVGGELHIASKPGAGTTVRAFVPLRTTGMDVTGGSHPGRIG